MKRIIVLFLACTALFACQPDNPPSGPIISSSGQPEGSSDGDKVRPRSLPDEGQEDAACSFDVSVCLMEDE